MSSFYFWDQFYSTLAASPVHVYQLLREKFAFSMLKSSDKNETFDRDVYLTSGRRYKLVEDSHFRRMKSYFQISEQIQA